MKLHALSESFDNIEGYLSELLHSVLDPKDSEFMQTSAVEALMQEAEENPDSLLDINEHHTKEWWRNFFQVFEIPTTDQIKIIKQVAVKFGTRINDLDRVRDSVNQLGLTDHEADLAMRQYVARRRRNAEAQ